MTVSAPQLGKTIGLGLWLLIGAWRDTDAGVRLPSWWTAPTYGMAEQGVEKLVEMARSAGLLRDHRMSPHPRVLLRNGGSIEGRSWENPENCYGPTVARIAVDEFGYLDAESHAALRSRVSETRTRGLGYMRYAGNVGEIGGEAEAIWLHAMSGAPGWAGRSWTWRDRVTAALCECGLNGQGTEIEHTDLHDTACERGRYLVEMRDLQARMSPQHFRQLYGAEWLDFNSLPVYTFERAKHVTTDAEYQPGLPIDVSCDFNVDPMCWILGQHKGDEAWAFDEIVIPGSATTDAACSEFIRRHPKSTLDVRVYGDASGNSRSPKSHMTDYQIIRQRLGGHYPLLSMHVPAANPPVMSRVNAFNARLLSGIGAVRYYVHPRCRTLATDLARVSWKPGTREIDKGDRKLTHASDADGYRIVRLYPVRAESAGRVVDPTAQRTYRDPILHMDT